MHHVPFTYAGTVDAYKLTSEMATTEEYAEQKKYPHSLFVADYAVTYAASWDHLNAIDMIFGKDYAAGGVDYTLRAPSEGSDYTGSGDSRTRHAPKQRMGQAAGQGRRIYQKLERDVFVWTRYCDQIAVGAVRFAGTIRARFCGSPRRCGPKPAGPVSAPSLKF